MLFIIHTRIDYARVGVVWTRARGRMCLRACVHFRARVGALCRQTMGRRTSFASAWFPFLIYFGFFFPFRFTFFSLSLSLYFLLFCLSSFAPDWGNGNYIKLGTVERLASTLRYNGMKKTVEKSDGDHLSSTQLSTVLHLSYTCRSPVFNLSSTKPSPVLQLSFTYPSSDWHRLFFPPSLVPYPPVIRP